VSAGIVHGVISARDAVRACAEQLFCQLGGYARDEGGVFAVHDAEVDAVLFTEFPEIFCQMLDARGTRDVTDNENFQNDFTFYASVRFFAEGFFITL
jgi:hypothetical protein